MTGWFPFALGALLLWGIWGFLPKLATPYMRPLSLLVYEAAGTALVGVAVLGLLGFRPEAHPRGAILGVLTGIAGGAGALCFLLAVSRGRASVVVTLTALYPLVTIALALLILREPLGPRQAVGMALALLAMALLARG